MMIHAFGITIPVDTRETSLLVANCGKSMHAQWELWNKLHPDEQVTYPTWKGWSTPELSSDEEAKLKKRKAKQLAKRRRRNRECQRKRRLAARNVSPPIVMPTTPPTQFVYYSPFAKDFCVNCDCLCHYPTQKCNDQVDK